MAKFECVFPNSYSFDDILQYFHTHLTQNRAEYTGGSDYVSDRVRVAVRVYERYSLMGDNYLSMTVTLIWEGGDTFASAISAAGRGSGFGVVVPWGEDKFVKLFADGAEQFDGVRLLSAPDRNGG